MTAGYHPVSCQSSGGTSQSLTQDSNRGLTYSVVRLFSPRREEGGREERALLLRSLQLKKTNVKRATSVATSLDPLALHDTTPSHTTALTTLASFVMVETTQLEVAILVHCCSGCCGEEGKRVRKEGRVVTHSYY